MLFHKMLLVLAYRDVQSLAGDKPTLVKGIFVWMTQGNKFIFRERQLRSPGHGFQGGISCPFQILHQRPEFPFRGHSVKTTHTYVDRVNLAPPDERHNGISGFLEFESA